MRSQIGNGVGKVRGIGSMTTLGFKITLGFRDYKFELRGQSHSTLELFSFVLKYALSFFS
jgi:hypothetical protein